MANAPNVEIVTKNPDIVGECPEWNAEQGELLWTDNRSQRVYGYSQATGAVRTIVEGVATYAFTQQRDGTLLLFLADTRVAIARDGTIEDIVDGLPGEEGARFNDVLVDSAGRVVCGVVSTGADGTGSLYSLALTSTPRATKLHGGMRMPNGMAFSPDEQVLYVADTRAGQIVAFNYDVGSGAATAVRPFIEFQPGEGSPDGITVDAEGCIWVAATGSGAVSRYESDGVLLERVDLPAQKPTSVGFGGIAMDTLFITSSSRESVPGEVMGTEAGALFAFKPGVTGLLDHRTDWKA
jgi:D-xylono/L-arabinono-1,4-lactonase